MRQNKNESLTGEVSMQTVSMCFISRTWPYLPEIRPACIIGVGPLCQMLRARSHTSLLGQTNPFFKPQLYTHIYRYSGMQTSVHRKTLTSTVFNTSFMLLVAVVPSRSGLFMSQEVMSEIVTRPTSCKRHKEVLFYQEAIKDNRVISVSIFKIYACRQTCFDCF